jgi:hypothetical protein
MDIQSQTFLATIAHPQFTMFALLIAALSAASQGLLP